MQDRLILKEFPLYAISKKGVITSINSGCIIKSQTTSKGYYRVRIKHINGVWKMVLVHRLVALAFIPNDNNYCCVNHIDANKKNNKISNLEWCSRKYNTRHAKKLGLLRTSKRRLTNEEVLLIKKLRNEGWLIRELVYRFDVTQKTISKHIK